jgi:GNAT superfamily N-acetyltransferase
VAVRIVQDKSVSWEEFGQLLHAVGWGNGYTEHLVLQSLAAYPFIAHARTISGNLVGYVSAFSDCAFSTMLGELVVHPHWQRQGVGRALLLAVEQRYSHVPVYVKALGSAGEFFSACGYQRSSEPMQVMFNRNGAEG